MCCRLFFMYYAVAATAFSSGANVCGSDLATLCSCTQSFPTPRAFLSALKYELFCGQGLFWSGIEVKQQKKGKKMIHHGKTHR